MPETWTEPTYQARNPLFLIGDDRASSPPGMAITRYTRTNVDIQALSGDMQDQARKLLEAQLAAAAKDIREHMRTRFFLLDGQSGLYPAQVVFLHHDLGKLETLWAPATQAWTALERPTPASAIHDILQCLPQGSPGGAWTIQWLPIEKFVDSGTDGDALPGVPYVRLGLEAPEEAPVPRLPGQGMRTVLMSFFVGPTQILHPWFRALNPDP